MELQSILIHLIHTLFAFASLVREENKVRRNASNQSQDLNVLICFMLVIFTK